MPDNLNSSPHLLAIDAGDKRIGIAIASTDSMLAKPLTTLINDASCLSELRKLISEYMVTTVVAGLPRSLSGQDTYQTTKVRKQIADFSRELGIQIITQDEALSSNRAEEELVGRGKIFSKADIDKLSACLILEDYILSMKT